MKNPIPSTFEEFISLLNLKKVSNEYEYFFRGCSTSDWEYNLVPGIYRNNQIDKEDKIFKELILQSPKDFLDEKTTLEKLVKMQHYTLPTRLLDITSNPLVALYFACQEFDKKKPKNGAVYIFKIRKEDIKYYDSDAVSLISNLAKLNINKAEYKNNFDYLIHEIRDEKPHFRDGFDDYIKEDIKKVFPVKVKLNNNRIVSQSGAFLIFGIENINSKKLPAILPEYNIEKKIIIKKSIKEDLLQYLKTLAINETKLFPELEHQANYLGVVAK
jgi:hypothetical protein